MFFLKQFFGRAKRAGSAPARRRRPALVAVPGIVSACLVGSAQLVPDAPVSNFRLPMFGDEGFLIRDLRGDEARYVSEDQIDLSGMRLLIFNETRPERLETKIVSPQATMFIQKNEIVGTETITVEGDNFLVTGEKWRWIGDEKSVVIDENVKVTFFEKLTAILQ